MTVSNLPIRRLFVVFISALLIALAFWLFGVEDVLRKLAGFPPWVVASLLVLLLANLFLVSFRFWRVLAHFGIAMHWKIALRANIAGAAAGLFVISLFGQIIGCQSVLQSFGVQPVVNTSLAAYECALLRFSAECSALWAGSICSGKPRLPVFLSR